MLFYWSWLSHLVWWNRLLRKSMNLIWRASIHPKQELGIFQLSIFFLREKRFFWFFLLISENSFSLYNWWCWIVFFVVESSSLSLCFINPSENVAFYGLFEQYFVVVYLLLWYRNLFFCTWTFFSICLDEYFSFRDISIILTLCQWVCKWLNVFWTMNSAKTSWILRKITAKFIHRNQTEKNTKCFFI